MKEMKRWLALLLCVVMLIGIMPVNAIAAEETIDNTPSVAAETGDPTEDTTEGPSEGTTVPSSEPEGTTVPSSEPEGTTPPSSEATEPEGTTTPSSEPTEPEGTTAPSSEPSEPQEIAVTGITLDVHELEVPVGTLPVTLTATVTPEDATDKTVTWTSSNEDVAFFDEDGLLNFGMIGEADITATAGGFSDTCHVTVFLDDDGITGYADENTTYVLAGGDFQEAGAHANSAANVTNILNQVSQQYSWMDGFLFIGDYDCETHDSATETANGITALMGAVQGKYSNLNDANSVLVQGNHDYMDSRIDKTGGHDFGNYAAYVLNEDDYPNGGGSATGIQGLANTMKTWLDAKIAEDYTAPIFVVSHLPLAYTPRTVTQGDAKYAKYIFDVLNNAGEAGLNIIFLHGHDHAYGPDNYMGGEAIYLAEGDKICIAEAGSTSAWTEETLNFTYMNAGYTGYYSDPYTYVTTAGTDKLTMTVFAITDSQVTVERYSANGLYNLKSAGYDGSYSNTNVTNLSLSLPKYSNVYASPQTISLLNSDSGEDSGDTEGGTTGGSVGVTPDVEDDVETSGDGWTTITEPTGGTTTYTYTQATSITAGEKYVIVGNSNAVALMDNNGYMGSHTVTISGSTMTSTTALTEWTFSGSSSGTIYNGTRYLRYNNSAFSLGTRSTTFTITDNGSNFRIQSGNYSFYYNGSSWTRSGRNTAQYVRLYQLTDTTTTGGTNGLYGKLEGDLSYTVTPGTSADDALAAVKNGITIKYATAADYSDEAEFADDGEGMSWVLDPAYNGTTPGDYAVTISYNGTVLGTAEVIVPATTTYYIVESEPEYEVAMNTSADDAMAAVKEKVTVYTASNAEGTDKTAIRDDDVSWTWVDTYDGKNIGPYTLRISKDGIKLADVEVRVNVEYETGIKDGWTYVGETEATGGSYTYTLDTDGIDYGEENKYIIVDDNEAIVLNAQSSSNGTAHSITISGNTATLDTRDYEYHMIRTSYNGTRYELITKGDGSQYLYQESNGVRYGTRSSVKFQVNHHGSGIYDIHDIDGTNWYIIYNGGWTVTETTSARVRLYKYTGTTGGTPGGSIYAHLEGNTVYTLPNGKSATTAMNTVKAGITGYLSSSADGSNPTELEDSALTWTWLNKFNGNVPGSYWVQISYNGEVLGTVEVVVNAKEPGVVNNYPEYPDEGSVKVSKTGTGIDFQSSGIAQVEVSASGVPIKKGADVIVMLDTSSSMTSHTVTGSSKTRAQVLEESLVEMIKQFKTPGDDGALMDLRVAIADFNGFFSSGAYARDGADTMSDDISYSANSQAKVYTGDGTLGAGAFIDAADLANSYTLNYTSGTNYDYAMDAIYQLGYAIKQANGSEERDLYVIFMSDGAAMQWNYYHSQGASSLWNNWITGAWTADQLTTTNLNCTTHAYYYDEVDHNGDGMRNEHRMANAIKGDPSETYEVIRKQGADWAAETNEDNMYMVSGLGAKMFSISFDAQADTNVTEVSMDKSIASLASEQTGTTQYYYKVTTADELANAFDAIGSEIAYAAYNARYVDQMGDDYDLQIKPFVDYNNRPLDANGDGVQDTPKIEILIYDIYTKAEGDAGDIPSGKNIGDRKGTYKVLETVTFNTAGTEAYSTLNSTGPDGKTITAGSNILLNGVIYANTFWYNTTNAEVAVTGVSIPTGTNSDGTTRGSSNKLPAETFYWKLGTVQTSELAMRYYVYLTGSMEGTREAGSYPTNEYATLYYDNYLGNSCKKDTVSPVLAWEAANVSYAFYLVNEKGEIIVNQTTGQTGTFANKIAVTNPVVYEEVLLNNTDTVESIEVASSGVLPTGYELYDAAAVYTIKINSDATGSWAIAQGDGTVASTYVTQYDPSNAAAYTNELTRDSNADFTHTVVWFAVLWKVQALPDTVVIDYGLPVDISVLRNDMFGEAGKLAGIGSVENAQAAAGTDLNGHTTALDTRFGENYTGVYGSAKADASTGKVRYTLNESNGMQMETYEKFAYAVNYTGDTNSGYYYDTVTVIPATTIYYEDSFVKFDNLTWQQKEDGQPWEGEWAVVENPASSVWTPVGTKDNNATQEEDRPGQYALTDANNIYGYDSVNLKMSTYSLGSAMKATVNNDNAAQASFTFTGTGFDVISMTDATTGTILVNVYPVNADNTLGEAVKKLTVDTYYGYTKADCHVVYTYRNIGSAAEPAYKWIITEVTHAEQDCVDSCSSYVVDALPTTGMAEGDEVHAIANTWIENPDASGAIWQVPVMKVENLTYGKYNAVIQAVYDTGLDHVDGSAAYDFYLDAIRIYDPANDGAMDNDTVIENAYKADGEGWPTYQELRNVLIDAKTLGNSTTDTKIIGEVFIDGDAEVGDLQITDYVSYGPNNEVYLAKDQSIAFMLSLPQNLVNVHIGIKSADGNPCTYTIKNIAKETVTDKYNAGDIFNEKTYTVDTTTDMYYDLAGWKDNIIVITNTGSSGILSLTNIKFTYSSNPYGTSNASVMALSLEDEVETIPAATGYTYMTPAAATLTLRSLNGVVEDDVPEDTVPETTVPEESVPETTVPEETEPETTEPEATKPDVEDKVEAVVKEIVKTVASIIKKLFGGWFR